MIISLKYYEPRKDVMQAILDAYTDKDWDWRDCDGCTVVSEMHSAKQYRFPPCVMHDYLRWKVSKGWIKVGVCDKVFYWAMIDYQCNRVRAFLRYAFVRGPAWWFWFKWTSKRSA